MEVTIHVPVVPKAQPRPRLSPHRPGVVFSGGKRYKRAVAQVARIVLNQAGIREPLEGPIHASVLCLMRRPLDHFVARRRDRPLKERAPKWCTTTPDVDNLAKAALDALNRLAWKDDAQVAACDVVKRYPVGSERVGVTIRIRTLEE